MNNFNNLSEKVLIANPKLSVQRLTVEKEIIHQDILRIMNNEGFLEKLTFMGGTCLRLCYNFARLSEDLDFSSQKAFKDSEIELLEKAIKNSLRKKYGTDIEISKPEKNTDTDTWIIKVTTHPEQKNIPSQKVHIDICHYPAYEREVRRVNDIYGINTNQAQLFIYAESLKEILADKLIALALRNRIKNRDIWDIMSINEKNIGIDKDLIKSKLNDRRISIPDFSTRLNNRLNELKNGFPADFTKELERFIPTDIYEKSILSKGIGLNAFTVILEDYLHNFLPTT